MIAPIPGIKPEEKADDRSPADGADGYSPFLPARQKIRELGLDDFEDGLLHAQKDFAHSEQPHDHRDEADPVVEVLDPEGKTGRPPHRVHADHGQQKAEKRHDESGQKRTSGQTGYQGQADHQEGEDLGRPETQGETGQGQGRRP